MTIGVAPAISLKSGLSRRTDTIGVIRNSTYGVAVAYVV
jgi:hypothetical protein